MNRSRSWHRVVQKQLSPNQNEKRFFLWLSGFEGSMISVWGITQIDDPRFEMSADSMSKFVLVIAAWAGYGAHSGAPRIRNKQSWPCGVAALTVGKSIRCVVQVRNRGSASTWEIARFHASLQKLRLHGRSKGRYRTGRGVLLRTVRRAPRREEQ